MHNDFINLVCASVDSEYIEFSNRYALCLSIVELYKSLFNKELNKESISSKVPS